MVFLSLINCGDLKIIFFNIFYFYVVWNGDVSLNWSCISFEIVVYCEMVNWLKMIFG